MTPEDDPPALRAARLAAGEMNLAALQRAPMTDPHIAQRKPCLVTLEKGKSYLWCSCGRSARQPFCDGSHKGTDFSPLKFTAEESGERLLCACKHTAAPPFCDGSHNNLSDTYLEAEEGSGAGVLTAGYEDTGKGFQKAALDNGCYVARLSGESGETREDLTLVPVISEAEGARHLSHYAARVDSRPDGKGRSPILRFPGSDAILFIISGTGTVTIADRPFAVGPETGLCVKAGEAFQLATGGDEALVLNISVCPQCPSPEWLDAMPETFDAAYPRRSSHVDESKREAMADRFFQVLIDKQSHATDVTQFIGEIPTSRAAHHRHLYEETITILSGEGFMWTDTTKAPVRPGDTIFLPRKQAHSLECTSAGGMRLVGVFYPSMSPALNY